MKIRLSLLIIGLITSFSVLSCKKKHDNIYGMVTIHGTVRDDVSAAPIPNATVQLVKIEKSFNGFWYIYVETEVVATTATDSNGNYSLSYGAKGEYELTLDAMPASPLYVPSNVDRATDGEHITTAGKHEQNLRCYRSAWAKIILTNKVPLVAPYAISISVSSLPGKDDITLNNFSGDTTVYLKLVGSLNHKNSIRFGTSEQVDSFYEKIVAPWDTMTMHLSY